MSPIATQPSPPAAAFPMTAEPALDNQELEPANGPGAEAILFELRRIAAACRELVPLFRGLCVHTTPTDADLAGLTVGTEATAERALGEASALLYLLGRPGFPAELEDLGILVQAEIDDQSQQLRLALSRTALAIWEKGSLAQGLSSKTLKAAIAVENACCEIFCCERTLSLESEITDALAVRRAYCKLWNTFAADPLPAADSAEVETQLRRGSTAIAVLLGRDVFLDLRLHDRRQILAIQRRIRTWLISGGASESGRPLLEDVVNLFVLLSQINNRIELLMHDESLVKRLLARLRSPAAPSLPLRDAELRHAVKPLLGRNPELDRLLLSHSWDFPAGELEALLNEIARRWSRDLNHTVPPANFSEAGADRN